MVKPCSKDEAIRYLIKRFRVGIKKASSVLGRSRSSFYYNSKLDDSELISKLNELVKSHPNRGFDNYYGRIKRQGFKWSRNRLLRVYREQGLVRRTKKRKRLPQELRRPLNSTSELNEVWSMDFMSDVLMDERKIRVLNVIDDYNRECIVATGSLSYPSTKVIKALNAAIELYGKPKYIRTDNGPEFISKDYKRWCKKMDITRIYSEPGKPMQNGIIERFNKTFREDILDAYYLRSVKHFNEIADGWKQDYNQYHPHKSLGKKSPQEFAKRRKPLFGVLKPQRVA